MGVDIYGRAPKLRYEKPDKDWTKIESEEEKKEYFDELEKFEDDNPGYYFRSNWWGWRPIVYLSEIAMENAGLDYNTDLWHENSGGGLEDGFQCLQLANALEHLLAQDADLEQEDDVMYINLGSWSTSNGEYVEEDVQDSLNQDWPLGAVKFTKVVGEDGNMYHPTHSSPVWHIKNWIKFLKECGGFEIY